MLFLNVGWEMEPNKRFTKSQDAILGKLAKQAGSEEIHAAGVNQVLSPPAAETWRAIVTNGAVITSDLLLAIRVQMRHQFRGMLMAKSVLPHITT